LSEAGLINPSGDSLILLYKNSIHSESSAALLILRILGLPWSILYGLIIVPRFIRDAAYRLIAKNRYRWFGKREACWLPGAGSANQFPDLVENGFDRAD
jgi:predicted DCC family thiol-disulfide oxidoreductase YuxK